MNLHNKFLFASFLLVFVSCDPCSNPAVASITDIVNLITFQYYTSGGDVDAFEVIPYQGAVEKFKNLATFVATKKTYIYFPGRFEDPSKDDSNTNLIVQAFQTLNQINLIVVNSVNVSMNDDATLTCQISKIARAIGEFLTSYVESGIQDASQLHLLGFDTGAHIMAGAAINYGPGQLILTALNPSDIILPYISTAAAAFIDIIYTDLLTVIVTLYTGHMNFYPEFPFPHTCQPYCCAQTNLPFDSSTCNHNIVLNYYAESVQYPTNFIGQCEEYLGILTYTAYMGFGLNINSYQSSCTSYDLTVNSASPFGKGDNGIP